MSGEKPKVTIGIPVYNGENFLSTAIESLLKQTYTDFELVISDNASTDSTEEICRHYLRIDSRVKYVRNAQNLGAAKNYNQLVDIARGKYFKWAAHDDVCAPEFLDKCVSILDSDPESVLCFTQTQGIDGDDQYIMDYDNNLYAANREPWKRFYETACKRHNLTASMAFGLMRTEVARKTHMIGSFASSDRVFVGEMALHGKFQMVQEVLFFKRDHAQAHWIQYNTRHKALKWYDPTINTTRSYAHWKLLQEHLVSIRNAPLTKVERVMCHATLISWLRFNWRYLYLNLLQKDLRSKSQKLYEEQDVKGNQVISS